LKTEGDLVGKHSCIGTRYNARYDRCIGVYECYCLLLALSLNSGIPGFDYPGVVFLLIEFSLCQQNMSYLNSAL
jgi:hypothetical protein